MSPVILHSQYFPSISWMQTFYAAPVVAIEQWENYQKQGLRNRCKILGAQGVITLSVPLENGREQKSLMKDVRINHQTRWHIDQQRAIKSCYGKAPFFEYYFDPVCQVLSKQHTFLLDLNLEVLQLIIKWIKWPGKVLRTDSFNASNHRSVTEPIVSVKPYLQVFSDRLPFQPNLSSLDALFCVGPQAKNLFTA